MAQLHIVWGPELAEAAIEAIWRSPL